MEKNCRLVSPGANGTLVGETGERLLPPDGWIFLPAGDAGITRKVTGKGDFWRVQVKVGKRLISKGIWAPSETIHQAETEMTFIRNTDGYQKKKEYNLRHREKQQLAYEKDFYAAVAAYLHFHPRYHREEQLMAKAISEHAVPIGSGTVARTTLIPIEERVARAVVAWMRHQTTAYDSLSIPHVKGERRAIRRKLAQISVSLLDIYRAGGIISSQCPLQAAIQKRWL